MMVRLKKPVRDEWTCGYAAALGALSRLYCQPSMVDGLIKADGLSLAKFKVAGVEEFDMAEIRKAVKR